MQIVLFKHPCILNVTWTVACHVLTLRPILILSQGAAFTDQISVIIGHIQKTAFLNIIKLIRWPFQISTLTKSGQF